MENNSRQVALDTFEDITVSTVFLGVDHNFGNGDPLLFETMIFLADGGGTDMWRYFTFAEAELGHKAVIEIVKQKIAQSQKVSINVIRELVANK